MTSKEEKLQIATIRFCSFYNLGVIFEFTSVWLAIQTSNDHDCQRTLQVLKLIDEFLQIEHVI